MPYWRNSQRHRGTWLPRPSSPGWWPWWTAPGRPYKPPSCPPNRRWGRSTAAFLRQLRSGYQEERYSELVLVEGLEEAEELLDHEALARLQRLRAHPGIAALIAGRKRLEQVVRKAGGLEDAGGERVALGNPRRLDSLIWTVAISYQRAPAGEGLLPVGGSVLPRWSWIWATVW